MILRYLFLSFLFLVLTGRSVFPQSNRITIGCKQYFLVGSNVAWSNSNTAGSAEDHFGWDFATRPWDGVTNGYSSSWWDGHFAQLQAQGANCARIWVHADGRADPEYSAGNISGSDPVFNAAMDDMLNKAKNHNIMIILCLWDAVVLGGTSKKDVVVNPAQTTNYINNVLIPMATRYKNQCNLLAYDVINEPEAMFEGGSATKAQLQAFAAKCAEAIHSVSSTYVTVGCKSLQYNSPYTFTANSKGNWWSDAALQGAYPAGITSKTKLDFYSPHFYYWMNDPGNGWDFAPFKRDAFLAGPSGYALDKPTIVGETAYNPSSPGVVSWTRQQMFDNAYTNNFAGVLFWASSPASGHGDSWANFSTELKNFHDAHTSVLDFTCAGGGGCCTKAGLGPDIIACGGVTLPQTLNANAGVSTNKTYTWKLNNSIIGGASSATYSASSAGTYVVVVDSGLVQHCIVSDTMVISASLIKPTLGSDKNLCIPAYYDFDAGSYAPSAVTYQWLKDGSIITGATAQTLTNVRAAGTYVVSVSSAGCTSVKDTVIVTSSLPVPTDGCGAIGTKVNLSVIGSGTYKWYGASTGTASYIQTGNAYLTPVLSSTTTYYVEDAAAVAGTAGPSTQFGSNYGRTPNADVRYNLWFNTGATPVNLDYVTVWAWFNATGTNYYINFRLLDNTNTVKQTVSVPVISTTCSSCWIQKRVPVGFTGIPAGVSGWKLDAAGSGGSPICDLNYASAGASYPYNSTPTGMLTITGQQDVTWEPNGYSFFYNWEISTGTPCSRLPVVATISSGCGAAPVELVRFNASEHNSNVVLVWQTASEAGNAYFTIERSLDNSRFENIGSVAGHGNSSVMLDYSFTDRYPPEGMSYYRLKQMDYNGHFTYSAVSAVSIKSAFTVNIYPVPVKESESLQGDFVLPAQQEIKIVCTDIYGQENFRFSLEGKEGKNSVTWPHRLRNGLYFLNITAGKETLVKKIMVQD